MSRTVFVAAYDPKLWEASNPSPVPQLLNLDADAFEIGIKSYRANAIVRHTSDDPNVIAYWHFPFSDNTFIQGVILSDRETLSFNDDTDSHIIELIAWYRSFIPCIHTLFFFKASSFERIKIECDFDPRSIIDFLH